MTKRRAPRVATADRPLATASGARALLRRRHSAGQIRYVLNALREVKQAMKRAGGADRRRELAPRAARHARELRKLLALFGEGEIDGAVHQRLARDLWYLEAVMQKYGHEAARTGLRVRFAKLIAGTEADCGIHDTTVREVIAWAIVAGFEEPDPEEDAWKKAVQRSRRGGHFRSSGS